MKLALSSKNEIKFEFEMTVMKLEAFHFLNVNFYCLKQRKSEIKFYQTSFRILLNHPALKLIYIHQYREICSRMSFSSKYTQKTSY